MDRERKRIASFLAHQRTGVLCCDSNNSLRTWAMPVWYRPAIDPPSKQKLGVDCLVPRWADFIHYLTQKCRVLFIVQGSSIAGLRWLTIHGTTWPVETPDWARLLPRWFSTLQPDALFLMVRVIPQRIDLVDEDSGWGLQETLEW
jgi:hypothetical protein